MPKLSRSKPESRALAVTASGDAESCARHVMHSLALSVLPAPDSPEIKMDCGPPVAHMTE